MAGLSILSLYPPRAFAEEGAAAKVLSGATAFGDWRQDAPGPSAAKYPKVVAPKAGIVPKVPQGFAVAPLDTSLEGPRLLRVAPNGDIFVAETGANRIRVLRLWPDRAKVSVENTFAKGLFLPFGIAFYPPGPEPQWIYVGNTDSVVRFPYRNGDLKARGTPETVVSGLPSGGHPTRDVTFSPDGNSTIWWIGYVGTASP
jgi:glucose/arabinose dehydrogenase